MGTAAPDKFIESEAGVTISDEPDLVNPENANTATTLNAPALANLPNPG